MERRTIPYGYRIVNGLLQTEPHESAVIERIFRLRLSGEGVYRIGAKLYEERLPFFDEDRDKSIKKVSAILYKAIYCGQKDYPAIIEPSVFAAVQALKQTLPCVTAKSTPSSVPTVPVADDDTAWTLILTESVRTAEEAILQQLQQPVEDISALQKAILQLADAKYDCITIKETM